MVVPARRTVARAVHSGESDPHAGAAGMAAGYPGRLAVVIAVHGGDDGITGPAGLSIGALRDGVYSDRALTGHCNGTPRASHPVSGVSTSKRNHDSR